MANEIPIEIEKEMKNSYMNYAMSVIVSRAIPDVRDGLKPIHRRILFAMNEMGLQSSKPHKKCGRIVGEVLGKFHPHGDQSIYGALVRMAQDFSMRYVAVDGHGNFGSVDDDPPAAMRYTEARLSKIAELMLKDINKGTVRFGPNYDDSMEEPLILPAAVPYLFINGTSGIAVGMATNIPPYNIGEIVTAICAQIDNPEITIKDLCKIIKGPDFPTAGIIFGKSGIRKAMHTGKGRVTIRARTNVEESKSSKDVIIVTEIPYQVNKALLIERIAELVKTEKIKGISHIRDESDRNGLRIVIELKKGFIPKVILNQLYNNTGLQVNFSINNLVLHDGRPKLFNMKESIAAYVDFRKEVIYRRTKFELKKAEERAHIVLGLIIAIENIDAVIELIKKSKDVAEAKEGLIVKFNLSEVQAQAILDMRLQRLTGLETQKLKDEYDELLKTISRLKEILSSDRNVLEVVKNELIEDTKPFIDERRTEIIDEEVEDFEAEDLIHKEDMVITVTHKGFIKRISTTRYKSQGKGGVGVSSGAIRDDDFVEHMFIASTHDFVVFISNKGLAYRVKVYELPMQEKTSRGQALKSIIGISEDEKINAIINVKNFTDEEKFFLLATKKAIIKKVPLAEFALVRQTGKKAIRLDENDEVIDAKITDGKQEIILATKMGKALRFNEEKIREMGRTARGIRGIKLHDDDELCGLCIVDKDSTMLMITEFGAGKRLEFENFKPHGRGTGGQRYYKYNEAKGKVTAVKQVKEGDDIMAISSRGLTIKIASRQISEQGRNASGIRLVRLHKPDYVAAVSIVPKQGEQIVE